MNTDQMQFFYEIFDSSLPRLGPGDNASTRKALEMLGFDRKHPHAEPRRSNLSVLDIGCGNGSQTIELAKHVDGTILAVDNHQPFLDELRQRAQEAGVADKIQVCQLDMAELGRKQKYYDLIWSEGALYSMGFNEGLSMCFNLLGEQGQMAVSELCWHQPDPPKACGDFFAKEYPPMVDTATNRDTIKQCGYELVGHFQLPGSAWMEGYYLPLAARLRFMRGKYAAEPEKLYMIETIQVEIDMYREYGQYYGYDFYLMQKP